MVQCQDRAIGRCWVRSPAKPWSRMEPILRPVLPHADTEGRCNNGARHGCHRTRPRHAVLHHLWLAVLAYAPASPVNIFQAITHDANPALESTLATAPVTGGDTAKAALMAASVNHRNAAVPKGTPVVKVGEETIPSNRVDFAQALTTAMARHGYPAKANPDQINGAVTVLLLTVVVIFVTMV
jgi:hypothetical protein